MKNDVLIIGGVALALIFIASKIGGAISGGFDAAKETVSNIAGSAADATVTVANAVNPLNHENVFSQGANAVTQALTGDQNQTLGGWIYDITH